MSVIGRDRRGRASLAGWSFAEAWVAGAILAATDPVAVVTESARIRWKPLQSWLYQLQLVSIWLYQFWLYQCY